MAPTRRHQENDKVCPLCIEALDPTERTYYPCPCGYQICLFCLDRIKQDCGSLCPGCRTVYGTDHDPFKKRVSAAEVTCSGDSTTASAVVAAPQGRRNQEHASRHQPSSSPTQTASHLRRQQPSSTHSGGGTNRQSHRNQVSCPPPSPFSNRQAQRQDRRSAAFQAATAQQHHNHLLQQQQQQNDSAAAQGKRLGPTSSVRPSRIPHTRGIPPLTASATSGAVISAGTQMGIGSQAYSPVLSPSQQPSRSQQNASGQQSAPPIDPIPHPSQHTAALYSQPAPPQLLLPTLSTGGSSNLGGYCDGLWAPPHPLPSLGINNMPCTSALLGSGQFRGDGHGSRQEQSSAVNDPWASPLWPAATTTGEAGVTQSFLQPMRQSRLAQYAQLGGSHSTASSTCSTSGAQLGQQQRSQQLGLPALQYSSGVPVLTSAGSKDHCSHSQQHLQTPMPMRPHNRGSLIGHKTLVQRRRLATPLEPLRLHGGSRVPQLPGASAEREGAYQAVCSGKTTASDAAWHLMNWLNHCNSSAGQGDLHQSFIRAK